MGKHVPLPSDPTDRAAEKRRRFKAYQKDWKKHRRALVAKAAISDAKTRRKLLAEANSAHLDLCVSLDDMSERQLLRALQVAEGWGVYTRPAPELDAEQHK